MANTIIHQLETEVPKGYWCYGCRYLENRMPSLSENGSIQSAYCDLHEEYVYRKICEING